MHESSLLLDFELVACTATVIWSMYNIGRRFDHAHHSSKEL